jgi:salicylate hydroxylase
MVGHRSVPANVLFEGCKREKGVTLSFSTRVEQVKSYSSKPSFLARPHVGKPNIVEVDVLLAADGVKNNARSQILVNMTHIYDSKAVRTGSPGTT